MLVSSGSTSSTAGFRISRIRESLLRRAMIFGLSDSDVLDSVDVCLFRAHAVLHSHGFEIMRANPLN
jgi:hypothetical protein